MSKILVAEDNKITQAVFVRMLEILEHEVIICANGLQAVSLFKEKNPELVILDVDMPEMNGFDACREIRKTPAGLNVPILLVSGGESEEDIVKGMNAGANDYLIKPVKGTLLSAKLKTLLSFSRLVNKDDLELVKNHAEIADRYIIEKILGHGSHSVVFLAKDRETGNHVAAKLVSIPEMESFSRAFVETVGKIENIQSPNILKIYDFGRYAGRFYIILEFVENGDLSSLLKIRRLSEQEAVKMALDLISGLKELDKHGIVHFDIKPENIMISGTEYKLGDFGIAAQREQGTAPIKMEIWSTAAYLPPEYLHDSSLVTSKSDIYSLGITIYQALTGENPFQSEKPSVTLYKQVNFIPPALETCDAKTTNLFSNAVALMMDKDPDKRPNLEEIEQIFRHILEMPAPQTQEAEAERETAASPMKSAAVAAAAVAVTAAAEVAASAVTAKLDAVTTPASPAPDTVPTAEIPHKTMMPELPFAKVVFSKSFATIILIAALSIIFPYLIYKQFNGSVRQSPPGALSSTICLKCQKPFETRITDIKTSKCPYCGGGLAYRRKCNLCNFEFPHKIQDAIPKNYKSATFDELAEFNKCPKCGSINTEPVPTSLETKRTAGGKR